MVIVKIKDVNDNSPEIFLNNIAGGETGAEVGDFSSRLDRVEV